MKTDLQDPTTRSEIRPAVGLVAPVWNMIMVKRLCGAGNGFPMHMHPSVASNAHILNPIRPLLQR